MLTFKIYWRRNSSVGLWYTPYAGDLPSNPGGGGGMTLVTSMKEEEITNCKGYTEKLSDGKNYHDPFECMTNFAAPFRTCENLLHPPNVW